MPNDVSAPARVSFLQTPETVFRKPELPDSAFRLMHAMARVAPINALKSEDVARQEGMGRGKLDTARAALLRLGHWHQRKGNYGGGSGYFREQRIVSLVALRTPEEVAAGWNAAWEAVRLGKDTAESRRLGVRIMNSVIWRRKPQAHYRRSEPSPGPTSTPAEQRRSFGNQSNKHQNPPPVPRQREPQRERRPKRPLPELPSFAVAADAGQLQRAERVLVGLRRCDPPMPLTAAEVRELAPLAAQYLVRGDTPQGLRNAVTSAPPQDGVRAPAAYVRQRLIRYLPPEPEPEAQTAPPRPKEPEPTPGGPVEMLRAGKSVREVLARARELPLCAD